MPNNYLGLDHRSTVTTKQIWISTTNMENVNGSYGYENTSLVGNENAISLNNFSANMTDDSGGGDGASPSDYITFKIGKL